MVAGRRDLVGLDVEDQVGRVLGDLLDFGSDFVRQAHQRDLGLAGEIHGLGDLDRHVDFLALVDAGRLESEVDERLGDSQVGQL